VNKAFSERDAFPVVLFGSEADVGNGRSLLVGVHSASQNAAGILTFRSGFGTFSHYRRASEAILLSSTDDKTNDGAQQSPGQAQPPSCLRDWAGEIGLVNQSKAAANNRENKRRYETATHGEE
jgi:hypothetical protein